jgi:anti-anti-sigma regulatory factor
MAIHITSLANACTRVTLDGALTVYEAVDAKRELLHALAASAELEVDANGLDEIDTAGLQLLLLLRREALRAAKPVRLAGASQALAEVLDRYGLAAPFDPPLETTA